MSLFEPNQLRVIGVVHLPPLPGSPRFGGSLEAVLEQAQADARALKAGGIEAAILENHGDAPFHKTDVGPVVVASMTRIGHELQQEVGFEEFGINVLRNDASAALSIAQAIGASFVRVNVHTGVYYADQGIIEGQAAQTLRLRRALDADISICADVAVKHATPVAGFDLETAARDTAYRGLADALIVSGKGTGERTDEYEIACVRAAVPDRPLLVGSGVTPDSIDKLRGIVDGVIVGTWLKEEGLVANPVDRDRVERFMEAATK